MGAGDIEYDTDKCPKWFYTSWWNENVFLIFFVKSFPLFFNLDERLANPLRSTWRKSSVDRCFDNVLVKNKLLRPSSPKATDRAFNNRRAENLGEVGGMAGGSKTISLSKWISSLGGQRMDSSKGGLRIISSKGGMAGGLKTISLNTSSSSVITISSGFFIMHKGPEEGGVTISWSRTELLLSLITVIGSEDSRASVSEFLSESVPEEPKVCVRDNGDRSAEWTELVAGERQTVIKRNISLVSFHLKHTHTHTHGPSASSVWTESFDVSCLAEQALFL